VASYYPDSQYCLSKSHARIAKKAGFDYIGSITSRFAEEGKNTGEYYDPKLRMAIPALYKTGGTGSAERKRLIMEPDDIKKIIIKLFVDNPREAMEWLKKPIYPAEDEKSVEKKDTLRKSIDTANEELGKKILIKVDGIYQKEGFEHAILYIEKAMSAKSVKLPIIQLVSRLKEYSKEAMHNNKPEIVELAKNLIKKF